MTQVLSRHIQIFLDTEYPPVFLGVCESPLWGNYCVCVCTPGGGVCPEGGKGNFARSFEWCEGAKWDLGGGLGSSPHPPPPNWC